MVCTRSSLASVTPRKMIEAISGILYPSRHRRFHMRQSRFTDSQSMAILKPDKYGADQFSTRLSHSLLSDYENGVGNRQRNFLASLLRKPLAAAHGNHLHCLTCFWEGGWSEKLTNGGRHSIRGRKVDRPPTIESSASLLPPGRRRPI